MIKEYHRPTNLDEALALLSRAEPLTRPLAGGSVLNRPSAGEFAVVDLQALGLDGFQASGNSLELGATLSLQNLLEALQAEKPDPSAALEKAIEHEATYNLRQVASVAGTLVSADGRSPFTTALLALDTQLTIQPDEEQISLGDLLPFRQERLRGRLITHASIPVNARLAYEYVARTPADRPIVCAALATWPSGRIRLALGGYGTAPLLAFDGGEAEGVQVAAQSAFSEAGDEWASAEYRQEIAGVLANRCLEGLTSERGENG
jgi:CO/xanthine dehydrogenase FAD-binding subunit